MKFVFGVAIGALGMWAYQSGKLDSWMGGTPEQFGQTAVDRFNQVAGSEPVRQAAAGVQNVMQRGTEIARPTTAEVAGRPTEPLPSQGA